MKATDRHHSIPTTPKGVWEASPDRKPEKSEAEHLNEITTDAQGNGYPVSNKKERSSIDE